MRFKARKLVLFIGVGLLIFTLSACKDLRNDKDANSRKDVKKEESIDEKEVIRSPFTGLETTEDTLRRRPFAVMLDNHFDAIPQSGLNQSDMIYEFKAEGEFTRYMAIFQSQSPSVIGPIRSARPYFVDTAKEYNAIYAHWGGSEMGYAEIPKIKVDDLDGIALEGITFYRNKDVKKKRPHDGYSSIDLMTKQSEKYKYDLVSDNKAFNFDTSENLDEIKKQMGDEICNSITLNFFKHYKEKYEYDANTNKYRIIRNEKNVTDEADGKDVLVSNLIVEFASSKVTGPLGTLTIDIVGQGKGLLLTNGKIINIEFSLKENEIGTLLKDIITNSIEDNPVEDAKIIVAGGRGIGKKENWKYVSELAKLLNAAIGCSRPVCEMGWETSEHQIGQTGKNVSPKVYIALGISGAMQHICGVKSDILIAINKDSTAPIMKEADYTVIADLNKFLPILIKELKKIKTDK